MSLTEYELRLLERIADALEVIRIIARDHARPEIEIAEHMVSDAEMIAEHNRVRSCFRCAENKMIPDGNVTCDDCKRDIYSMNPNGITTEDKIRLGLELVK